MPLDVHPSLAQDLIAREARYGARNYKPLDVVLSVRGTVLEPTDLVADLSLAYGFRSLIPRFTRAKRVC